MNDSSATRTKKITDIAVLWLKQRPDCNCASPKQFQEKKMCQSSTSQTSKSITKFRAIAGNVASAFIVELVERFRLTVPYDWINTSGKEFSLPPWKSKHSVGRVFKTAGSLKWWRLQVQTRCLNIAFSDCCLKLINFPLSSEVQFTAVSVSISSVLSYYFFFPPPHNINFLRSTTACMLQTCTSVLV